MSDFRQLEKVVLPTGNDLSHDEGVIVAVACEILEWLCGSGRNSAG